MAIASGFRIYVQVGSLAFSYVRLGARADPGDDKDRREESSKKSFPGEHVASAECGDIQGRYIEAKSRTQWPESTIRLDEHQQIARSSLESLLLYVSENVCRQGRTRRRSSCG